MIQFQLAHPSKSTLANSDSSNDVMVYMPGQDYVMFNGLKIQLDRVLSRANENWIGCVFCPYNRINFIECPRKSGGGVIVHSAEIVSSSTTAAATTTASVSSDVVVVPKVKRDEDDSDEDDEDSKISSMRVRQAAVLLKATKRASESVGEVLRLIKLFDREAEVEGFSGSAKLGIVDCLRKRRGGEISLHAMERTLQMIEDESVEIIHEELDIPPLKRLRH
jgi:hypothetical protein